MSQVMWIATLAGFDPGRLRICNQCHLTQRNLVRSHLSMHPPWRTPVNTHHLVHLVAVVAAPVIRHSIVPRYAIDVVVVIIGRGIVLTRTNTREAKVKEWVEVKTAGTVGPEEGAALWHPGERPVLRAKLATLLRREKASHPQDKTHSLQVPRQPHK